MSTWWLPDFFDLLADLAWPITVICILCMFKPYIIEFFRGIENGSFSIGNFSATFNKKLREIKEDIDKSNSDPTSIFYSENKKTDYKAEHVLNCFVESNRKFAAKYMIMEAWTSFEDTLKETVVELLKNKESKLGKYPYRDFYSIFYSIFYSTLSSKSILDLLVKNKFIGNRDANIINEFRKLRNIVAHDSGFSIDYELASSLSAWLNIAKGSLEKKIKKLDA